MCAAQTHKKSWYVLQSRVPNSGPVAAGAPGKDGRKEAAQKTKFRRSNIGAKNVTVAQDCMRDAAPSRLESTPDMFVATGLKIGV